ncbi:LLM class flavin-dependent oxidoreductase [Pseudonocardia sp. CA-142604]|uniref:LLM class flavin-dependent oxidoreductase n=1 Tax=Pseudonocardia sp. CA-142604 TaxID=3240024 RepID=UPI003D92F8C4
MTSHPELPLSILDLAPVPAGGTAADAIRNSVDLARAADRAGYNRFWVAEHHGVTGVASSSAPVLVAMIAGATERIRVGSGAVLMPPALPMVAAEQMGEIAALHPGRIDLGLGRTGPSRRRSPAAQAASPASGGTPPEDRVVDGLLIPTPPPGGGLPARVTVLAPLLGISFDTASADYAQQVADILSYLDGTAIAADGLPLHVAVAEGADLEVWVLAAGSGDSATTAGAAGLPLAAAYHVVPSSVLDTVEAYRTAFRPGTGPRRLERPYVAVSADVVVADDDATAEELAAPYGQWVLGIRRGTGAEPYVTPEQARARVWTDEERAAVADRVSTQIVGSPSTVVEKLWTLARVTGADELIVTTITTEHTDRVRSYELLAKAWAAG